MAGADRWTNAAGGLLTSKDGAVTLVGDSIAQLGGIAVTTSATRPGSILLSTAANVTAANGSGNIILGPASLTSILPDEGSNTITTGVVAKPNYFQDFLQPQINILATGSVDVQAGAFIKAPSAAVTVNAGIAGTVLLETGSTIDLSGLVATASVQDAILSIKITPAEVADTPAGPKSHRTDRAGRYATERDPRRWHQLESAPRCSMSRASPPSFRRPSIRC